MGPKVSLVGLGQFQEQGRITPERQLPLQAIWLHKGDFCRVIRCLVCLGILGSKAQPGSVESAGVILYSTELSSRQQPLAILLGVGGQSRSELQFPWEVATREHQGIRTAVALALRTRTLPLSRRHRARACSVRVRGACASRRAALGAEAAAGRARAPDCSRRRRSRVRPPTRA